MHEALRDAAREFSAVDGWPDGWIGVRNTLHWDKEHLDSTSIDQLKVLEQELAPRELLAKIKAKVLSRGAFGADLDDQFEQDDSGPKSAATWYYKAQEEAEMLGKAAAFDPDALAELPSYVSGAKSTDKSWNFGFGIGQVAASTLEILDRIKQVVPEIKKDGVNSLFIRGLVAGWNKTKPSEVAAFLECALTDEVWGEVFPELQVAVGIDAAGYDRLVQCIQIGTAPAWQFKYIGMGRATAPLSVEQIASLVTLLAAKPDGGLLAAIDVLYMVIHGTDSKDEQYKENLRTYCLKLISELDWSLVVLANENFLHHLERIIEFALESSKPHEATRTLNRMIQHERSGKRIFHHRLGNFLLPFFKKYPIQTLDAVYAKDEETAALERMLTVRLDRHGDTAIGVVPEEFLIEWCRVSPEDRCIFAARTCKLFERQSSGDGSDEAVIGISNTATALLVLAPDKKKVLETLVSRFKPNSWSGSLAAIMRQRLQHLDDLNPTSNPELTTLIEETKARLLKVVEREDSREQEQERSKTGSFE